MAKSSYEESNHANRLQWFFFVIVIPVIFAITLTWIVLAIAGVSIGDMAKKYGEHIPVVSSLVTTDEEERKEEKVTQLQSTIAKKDDRIEQLEEEIAGKDAELKDLNQQVGDLEAKMTVEGNTDEDKETQVKQISASFKDIDPVQAATIIANLDASVAITVLEKIPNSERGAILAEMDPEEAASLTDMFINRDNG